MINSNRIEKYINNYALNQVTMWRDQGASVFWFMFCRSISSLESNVFI